MMMKKHASRKSESGQSATELALMMPIIFALVFWAIQVNIIMIGYHQLAYASFMGARSFEVTHGDGNRPEKVMKSILTGKVFTESVAGRPSISTTKRKNPSGNWKGRPDGVKLDMPNFASLPYARGILDLKSSVPTHLGPDEWDKNIWSDETRDTETKGQPCELTDNNMRDGGKKC